MAKVCFKNLLSDNTEFVNIDQELLLGCVYEFARTSSDEIYNQIINEKVTLRVNNEVIHPDSWYQYKLDEDDEIIIMPVLEKDDAGAFAMMFIGAILIAVSGPLAAWIGIEAISASTIALTGLAIGLGGLSWLLFQPDMPSFSAISSRQTQTYNWTGIKTSATTNTPIPIVYGTHEIGGNIISLYTESYGDDSYLNMLIALCEGEIDGIVQENDHTSICTTSDRSDASYENPAILINDQPLKHFNDVTWWYRKGNATLSGDAPNNVYNPSYQDTIPGFNSARLQYDDGREITTDGITYTTTKEVDMVTLHVFAPALYDVSSGTPQSTTAKYKIMYNEVGGSENALSIKKWGVGTDSDGNVISGSITGLRYHTQSGALVGNTMNNAPSYCICSGFTNSRYKYGDYKPNPIKVKVVSNSYAEPTNGYALTYGRIKYPFQIIVDIYEGNDIIQEGRILNCYTEVYVGSIYNFDRQEPSYEIRNIDHVTPTFIANDYRIRLTKDVKVHDTFTLTPTQLSDSTTVEVTDVTKTGKWSSVTIDFNALSAAVGKDVYEIQVIRTDQGTSSDLKVENKLVLHSVTEMVRGNFIYPHTALLGLRIKASGQLSGGPPNITTIVRGTKISVPDLKDAAEGGSDVTFDDAYWDGDNSVWKKLSDSSQVYWQDATSWRTEYSHNSLLCVRDIITNTRYGLGEYITTSDLYSTGIKTAIKECHRGYDPPEDDHFSWWYRKDRSFDKNILLGNTATCDVDRSNGKITFSGNNNHFFFVKMASPLIISRGYTFSITLASTSQNTDIKVYTAQIKQGAEWTVDRETLKRIGTLTNKGDGTHTFTFTGSRSGQNCIFVVVDGIGIANLSGEITDISLNDNSNKVHYHTFHGVIESGQSATTTLLEMCDSFRCWPVWYNGRFNFILDTDDTPTQTLSMANMFSFTQSFTPLSDIPYKLTGQYTDSNKNYDMQSIIARSTDTTLNKLNESTVGLKGITERFRAERELIWKLNKITNCSHKVKFKCGMDMLHSTAGDIIYLPSEIPAWSDGGRVLSCDIAATTVTIENSYTFSNVATDTFLINMQKDDNSFVTATLDVSGVSNGDSLQELTLQSWVGSPCVDSVYAIGVSSSYVKKFRLISAIRDDEEKVECEGIEHLSSLYSEPSVTVVEDDVSRLPDPRRKPGLPRNISVAHTDVSEGIGFIFRADPPLDDTSVSEIIVQMSNDDDIYFHTINIITPERGYAKYIDNNLTLGESNETGNKYTFRFYCRTRYATGDPVEIGYTLKKEYYKLDPPTGIKLKESSPNTISSGNHTFSKDVHLVWNSVGSSYLTAQSKAGYKIEVYNTSISRDTLLRTGFTTSEEFIYSLEDNIEDGGPYPNLIFLLYTINSVMVESIPVHFRVSNTSPSTPTGLAARSIIGGVQFSWNKNTELDLKSYMYQTKVESDAWSNATSLIDNVYSKSLNATEIDTYGKKASVSLKVKAVDWYDQSSSYTSSVTASADTVADNIFQLIASKSAGSGNVASLYDGNYS